MIWFAIIALVGLFTGISKLAGARAARFERPPVTMGRETIGFLTVVWAVVTMLAFVPGGLVLALLGISDAKASLMAVPLLALCVTGTLYVAGAFRLPYDFANDDAERIEYFGRFAMKHHAAVAAFFSMVYLVEPYPLAFVLTPCVIGFVLGYAAHRAARTEALPIATAFELEVKKL